MTSSALAPGVWGVVATPFSGSTLEVDEGSLVRLVSHYESIGVTGLTVLADGSQQHFNAATKRALAVSVRVEQADGDIRVSVERQIDLVAPLRIDVIEQQPDTNTAPSAACQVKPMCPTTTKAK